jgi:hypothetical protein
MRRASIISTLSSQALSSPALPSMKSKIIRGKRRLANLRASETLNILLLINSGGYENCCY